MKLFYALLAVTVVAGPAFAATPRDGQEAKVRADLTSQGFSKWRRIELDQGVWEVDDAIDASGKQFDLRIDAGSLKTISKIAE